jgi:hypothetical protein
MINEFFQGDDCKYVVDKQSLSNGKSRDIWSRQFF